MIEVQQIQPRLYQDIITIKDYVTQNSWGQHSNLKPGEYRQIINYELYDGFIKSRRGSKYLRPSTAPAKNPSSSRIKQRIVWDVGDEEHLIFHVGDKLYSQRVSPTVANSVEINDFTGGIFTLSSVLDNTVADFVLEGGRLYIFHRAQNAIVQWDSGTATFKARNMGMVAPQISTVVLSTSGSIFGQYTYGIEKVYQENNGDVLASSPNRFKTDRTLATIGPIENTGASRISILVDPTELESDTLWTHVRLWRSKNQVTDDSNANFPIDPQGLEDELYEVCLITRAELTGSLAAISTSTDNELPAGNVNIEAGQPGGVGTDFQIIDNNTDDYLTLFIGPDDLELQPIPQANLGVSHGNRIYFADLGTTTLSDGYIIPERLEGSVFYTNNADGAHGEQFKVSQNIPTPLDGQKVTKLITFEKELFIIKEAKTLRVPFGTVTERPELMDSRIGTPDKTFLEFIPTLGVCGKTNDYGDFRILGFDFVWRSTFNGIDISKPIRNEMNSLVAGETSYIYINGKLFVCKDDGTCYVLNTEQGLGWSTFQYRATVTDKFFTFANSSRAGIVSQDEYLVEIEVEDFDYDVDTAIAYETALIDTTFITHQFRSEDGADVLEHEWLSVMAKADKTIQAVPYVNEVSWPEPTVEKWTDFEIDPDSFSAVEKLNDREHRLFIAPEQQGIFLFNRMIGNFLHYKISTSAPCIFKSQRLHVIVDEDGLAWGDFDPFQVLPGANLGNKIIETGVAANTYTETGVASDDIIEEN